MEFEFKIGDVKCSVGPLTLGTARMVKREFGVDDVTQFDWTNPDYMAALCYLGLQGADPAKTHEALIDEVEGLDLNSITDSIASSVLAELEKVKVAEAAGRPRPSRAAKATTRKKSGAGSSASSR